MAREGETGRLEERVKQDLAIIINYRLADPRLRMVSITRVELMQDNQFGRVHYSVLGEGSAQRMVQRALEHARGRIQGLLARNLKTRHTPRLSFVYDPGLARSARIGEIFSQLEREQVQEIVADANAASDHALDEDLPADHESDGCDDASAEAAGDF
jgi:ribosome-binding factor A